MILLVVLGIGIGGTLYLTRGQGGNKEILLEPVSNPGPDPYTPQLGALPSVAAATGNPATTNPAITNGATPGPVATATLPTANPGQQTTALAIYGGSGSNVVCDKAKLVAFLQANPAKAAAWASTLGITPDQIPAFVAALEPAVLSHDTRVTNHGFANGQATERQSILQAGTHVLLDAAGVPVTRCLCGNPLLPAKAVSGPPTYTGTQWTGFNPSTVVASTQLPLSLQGGGPGVTTGPTVTLPAPTTTAPPTPEVTAPPSYQPAAGNLVVDGGFEDGLVAPWGTGIYEPRAEIFWGAAQASASVVTTDAHSGANALLINNASTIAPQIYRTMSQAVPVKSGAAYCLTFWVKSPGAQPGILSFPLENTWGSRIAVQGGSEDWTEYAGTVTAQTGSFDVRLISENQGSILVDDIELTAGVCVVSIGPVPPGQSAR